MRVLCGAIALLLSGLGSAQVHERQVGPYSVRANVVSSTVLDLDIARRHGIVPTRNMAVLNVVMLDAKYGGRTLQGGVAVRVNRAGHEPLTVPMREITENASTSYVGTFGFTPQEDVFVEVTVRPANGSRQIRLEFHERMPAG